MTGAVNRFKGTSRYIQAIKVTFAEYAALSTIQGFQYLVDPKGNVWTKLFWIIISTSGILAATALVFTFWQRHISNPTQISIESNHMLVVQLMFPSITFCHINQISEIRASQFIKTLTLPSNVTETDFQSYLNQAAGFINKIPYNRTELHILDEIIATNGRRPTEVMAALVQPCDDYLIKCRWENEVVPCKTIFDATFTYYGNCCTFNSNNKINYTNHFGTMSGLSVALRPLMEKNSMASVFSNGHRVLIHDARHYASQASNEKVLQVKSEVILQIYGKVTVCGDTVRQLPQAQRNCLFRRERKLRFFNAYLDANCDTECLFAQILATCGCLPFNYAIVPDINVCNFSQIHCLIQNYYNFHEGRDEHPCHCPQSCESQIYNIVANKMNFRTNDFKKPNLTIDPFYDGLDDKTIVVHFNNAKQVFRKQRRDALTNVIYLAANFGGVYSLFVGVSVMTLLEIIYFATVRVVRKYNQLRRDQTQL